MAARGGGTTRRAVKRREPHWGQPPRSMSAFGSIRPSGTPRPEVVSRRRASWRVWRTGITERSRRSAWYRTLGVRACSSPPTLDGRRSRIQRRHPRVQQRGDRSGDDRRVRRVLRAGGARLRDRRRQRRQQRRKLGGRALLRPDPRPGGRDRPAAQLRPAHRRALRLRPRPRPAHRHARRRPAEPARRDRAPDRGGGARPRRRLRRLPAEAPQPRPTDRQPLRRRRQHARLPQAGRPDPHQLQAARPGRRPEDPLPQDPASVHQRALRAVCPEPGQRRRGTSTPAGGRLQLRPAPDHGAA